MCVFVCVPVCVQPLPAHRQKDNNSHVLLNSCTNMTAVCDTRGLPTGQQKAQLICNAPESTVVMIRAAPARMTFRVVAY